MILLLNDSDDRLFALIQVQCPMGLDASGMPLGVQAVATPGLDRLLIAVAKDLEQGFGGWRPANNH